MSDKQAMVEEHRVLLAAQDKDRVALATLRAKMEERSAEMFALSHRIATEAKLEKIR